MGLKMGRFTSSQCSARTWIVSDGNMSFVQWWSVAYVSGGPANINELTGCFTSQQTMQAKFQEKCNQYVFNALDHLRHCACCERDSWLAGAEPPGPRVQSVFWVATSRSAAETPAISPSPPPSGLPHYFPESSTVWVGSGRAWLASAWLRERVSAVAGAGGG